MRRLISWLPYLGLALLATTLLVRGFRTEGLDLPEFPRPPVVELPASVLTNESEELRGRVVDEAGEAVSEALVLAEFSGELTWDYSDLQGHFKLQQLPSQELDVSVLARTFATQRLRTRPGPEELLISLGEPAPPPPSLPLIGQSNLEGEVIAAIAGRGLLGYEVQLIPKQPPQTFGAPIPMRAEVGADRTFRFQGLIHGEYLVRVLPPWARAGSWPNLVSRDQLSLVHSPAVKSTRLQLEAGEIASRLVDGEGEFVRGAVILVEPAEDRGRPWFPAQSGDHGEFLVRDLPPGRYRLEVASGEARIVELVEVLAGVTSEVDLPPLLIAPD